MLGEMFEGDSADTCTGNFPLMSMGGQAEGLAYADPGARTRIGVRGNYYLVVILIKDRLHAHYYVGLKIKLVFLKENR